MPKPTLTPKQRRFVEEYIIDLNGADAARRAGYSAKSANDQAKQNLALPQVQAALQALMAERSKRTEITADKVLREFGVLGFATVQEAVAWGGSGLSVKHSALVSMGRHLGMFVDKTEVTGKNGGPIQTMDLSNLTDEQLAQIKPLLVALATGGGAAGAGEGGGTA